MTISHSTKSSNLYKTSKACHLNEITKNENPNLWPQRLGHMGEKGMQFMHSKGKLPSIYSIEINICEDCIFRQ